jgi:hypothetical protein
VLKPGTSLTLHLLTDAGHSKWKELQPNTPPPQKKLPKKLDSQSHVVQQVWGRSFPTLLHIKNLSFEFYEIKKLTKKLNLVCCICQVTNLTCFLFLLSILDLSIWFDPGNQQVDSSKQATTMVICLILHKTSGYLILKFSASAV